MFRLIIEIISRFLESFFANVPEIPKDWFVVKRILFYISATIIYILAFTVIFSVFLIVIFVAYPVSLIYAYIKK
ncbi:MAG: hypothetical protein GTO02_22130 [Candidatus Dadabacteria bacterium]|nr:hypothetical protein [Candidatus Dadabacteria bacterium]NIQ16981.1 hypothetical protein [Candidatus Dadabacteria bacterium]